ncbi:extracellular solute-binding protein [Paenibacillus yanchengensis]|uniref:Extracellular solute-binding protein n=1 Tax=Paenibacillus yanchengensis TaxID=2035833 RepID=A0ABW4YJ42_9BACL
MKKKMTRKTVLSIVTYVVLMTLLVACGSSGNSGGTPSTTPGTTEQAGETNKPGNGGEAAGNEPITLKMLASRTPVHADYKDMMVWKDYEQMSGVTVEWDLVPDANFVEKRNILLAGGDYPDAIYRALLSNSDVMARGGEGVFIKLNDLIEQHAPNLMKLFEKYPEVRSGITQADGNIYSLPFVSDFESANYGGKMFINKKWLDQIGMAEPETTDDFYKMLKAFKEKDGNGNAQADEIPLTSTDIESIINALKGFWGLGNRGGAHPLVDMNEETNELRFIPGDDRYKEVLEFLNKLYKEDLIDKEIFTMNSSKLTAKGEDDLVGSFIFPNPVPIGQKTKDNYIGMHALKGPYGDQIITSVNPVLRNAGAFVITNKNQHPERTMQWVDYWYSEEGMELFFMGKEGETFTKTADGQYQYVEDITNNPNGLTLDEAVGQHMPWPGSGQPTVQTEKFSKGGASYPSAMEATAKVSEHFPKEVWTPFTHTQAESDFLASVGNDITTYVNEMKVKFISGSVPFSEWEKYMDTLNKMGLNDYMDVYKEAYNRYTES